MIAPSQLKLLVQDIEVAGGIAVFGGEKTALLRKIRAAKEVQRLV